MPLIAWAAVAYAAGLLAALSSPPARAALVAVLAAGSSMLAVRRHRPDVAAVFLLVSGGVLAGSSAAPGPTWQTGPSAPALAAVRAHAGARIDRLFGPDAPIVRALVIADMS